MLHLWLCWRKTHMNNPQQKFKKAGTCACFIQFLHSSVLHVILCDAVWTSAFWFEGSDFDSRLFFSAKKISQNAHSPVSSFFSAKKIISQNAHSSVSSFSAWKRKTPADSSFSARKREVKTLTVLWALFSARKRSVKTFTRPFTVNYKSCFFAVVCSETDSLRPR